MIDVILEALGFLIWLLRSVVIVQFIVYLLLVFNVVSFQNRFVGAIWEALNSILDPFVIPIRRRLPPVGNMDFSYMVLIFGLSFVSWLISLLRFGV